MKEDFTKVKVHCPKCDFEFTINPTIFRDDSELTCFNCGFKFSLNGSIAKAIKKEIPKINAELKKRIIEAEKGNIKLTPEEIREITELLKGIVF